MNTVPALGLLLYCRPGFEKECAHEAQACGAAIGVAGVVETKAGSGFVHYMFNEPSEDWQVIAESTPYHNWIFARQRVVWVDRIENLPTRDRATPIAEAVARLRTRVGRIWGETADTNDAKELSGFLRRVTPYLEAELGERRILRVDDKSPTLHLFFHDAQTCDIGFSIPGDANAWPMGIARLRMPRNAPSRSTLKLIEAFDALLTADERRGALRAGLKAVDLGAAPGGWSFHLAELGFLVTAVDNGPLADSVKATEMVEHVRADGFTFRSKHRVEWMVCDMVEQPGRVASLVADWVASERCRRSIFNLKLPMKKRSEELARCRKLIETRLRQTPGDYEIRFKHLYHDREEVTGYVARLS